MPGRTFSGPADFNTQLVEWLPAANHRFVRRLAAQPDQLIELDRAAMLTVPPVAPSVGWHQQVRLGRDYYVRVASNDYSVDPAGIGTMVDVTASLDQVVVTRDPWPAGPGPTPARLGGPAAGHRPGPCRDRCPVAGRLPTAPTCH